MTDDLSVFDLPEEGAGDDPLATALSQAASWQARAERLEGAVEVLESKFLVKWHTAPGVRARDMCWVCRTSAEPDNKINHAPDCPLSALSSPRPEPSALLTLARSSLAMEIAMDALESGGLSIEESQEVEETLKEAEADLYAAVNCLSGEEKAAILGE